MKAPPASQYMMETSPETASGSSVAFEATDYPRARPRIEQF